MKGHCVFYKKEGVKFEQEYLDSGNTHFLFFSDGKKTGHDVKKRSEQYSYLAKKIHAEKYQQQGSGKKK